ncbi:hypothetical protein PRIPAC_81361, partial [Pristionchus pacificus]
GRMEEEKEVNEESTLQSQISSLPHEDNQKEEEKKEVKIFDELRLRIQFLLSIFFIDLHPSAPLWRRCTTLTMFTFSILINLYYALFFFYKTIINLSSISIYSLNALIQVIFAFMSGSAVIFIFFTQRSNALADFTEKISKASSLVNSPHRILYLRRLSRIFTILVLLNIIYGILFSIAYAGGVRPKSVTNPKYAVR